MKRVVGRGIGKKQFEIERGKKRKERREREN